MEAGLKKLEAQEQKYSAELDKALSEYAELKAQVAELDPVELYAARQAIRPAHKKVADGYAAAGSTAEKITAQRMEKERL